MSHAWITITRSREGATGENWWFAAARTGSMAADGE
jgi:hypothetical protein